MSHGSDSLSGDKPISDADEARSRSGSKGSQDSDEHGKAGSELAVQDFKRCHGVDWFMAKHRSWRRGIIRRPWLLPMAAMHMAAAMLQRTWRKCWLRAACAGGGVAHSGSKEDLARGLKTKDEQAEPQVSKQDRSKLVRERMRRRYLEFLKRQYDQSACFTGSKVKRIMYRSFEHYCAAIIQSTWRARRVDYLHLLKHILRYKKATMYSVAAFEIQQAFRDWQSRRIVQHDAETRQQVLQMQGSAWQMAAVRVQRAWRQANDYRMFLALREIIASFQKSGDPYLLLKSIAPTEAQYLDPAMQVHVRFRLGGAHFPPTIYYKIFTHGRIVDVCAFAPRDYAAERAGRGRHKDDWYERVENNGWRPIVQRAYRQGQDEVEKRSSIQTIPNFHHSRLRRRQGLERERQKRKSEWMRKLYTLKIPGPASAPQTARGPLYRTAVATGQQQSGGSSPLPSPRGSGSPAMAGDGLSKPKSRLAGLPAVAARSSRSPVQAWSRPESAANSDERYDDHGGGHYNSHCESQIYGDGGSSMGRSPRTSDGGFGASARHRISQEDPQFDDLDGPLVDGDEPLCDEKLLEWTQQLDFDTYMHQWSKIATSDASEGKLPISSTRGRAEPSRVHLPAISVPRSVFAY